MKKLSTFSLIEWLLLKPLKVLLKEVRNDLLLCIYKRIPANGEEYFLSQVRSLSGENVISIVAFEQDEVLDWALSLIKKNLNGCHVLVFDNSRDISKREKIKNICRLRSVPYLSLPRNLTRHPNRSHGMAMTWIYDRIICQISPNWFGYLDHDMVPVRPVHLDKIVVEAQEFYGLLRAKSGYWNLWAGYCFFNFKKVSGKPLNFLYDFSRSMDTGGRNWDCLYVNHDLQKLILAEQEYKNVTLSISEVRSVQLIDENWVHIGSVSYNNNLDVKKDFYKKFINKLLADSHFDSFL